jgi:glycosyltransferase involved in cell wall biosynthesis
MKKKYVIILLQPSLRKFVLNFGNKLKNFVFKNIIPPQTGGGYNKLPNFEQEIKRYKTHYVNRLRRFLGIPNIRPYFKKEGDLLFTYACLMLTTKPYCTYIETGLALYNYDLAIAKNPIANFLVSFFASRSNCKKLIFVSEASRKSFYSTINYSEKVRKKMEEKSIVIYPIPIEKQIAQVKKFNYKVKFLFAGTFYIKGGMELVKAYEMLSKRYSDITLTIITAIHMLKKEDTTYIQSLPNINLLDAKLNEQEMIEIYQSHDIFLLPTFRDGFGLVLIEALAYGMPLIITDQYATSEMAIQDYNGFIYPNHPLKDYDPDTYKLFGRYYNPRDFYSALFKFQQEGKMKPVEDFIYNSMEKFILNPALIEEFSKNSLELYNKKFHYQLISDKIESIFLDAIKK